MLNWTWAQHPLLQACGFAASQGACFSRYGRVHGSHHPAPSARIGGCAFGSGVLAWNVPSVTARPSGVRWFSFRGVVSDGSKISGRQVHHSIPT